MAQSFFDPDRYKWREVMGEPELSYKVHHDYTILGYDLAAGTLDMVVRWEGDGGHCMIHRHTATTTILVLEGEQHLWDLEPDGTRFNQRMRSAGDYALTLAGAPPHLERGGDEGGVVFFGNHSNNGLLYEYFDEEMNVLAEVSMELLIADWKENT